MNAPDFAVDETYRLGCRRSDLLDELAIVEVELHARMREMRACGATLQEIIDASGYRSINGVRRILDPEVKARMAAGRSVHASR